MPPDADELKNRRSTCWRWILWGALMAHPFLWITCFVMGALYGSSGPAISSGAGAVSGPERFGLLGGLNNLSVVAFIYVITAGVGALLVSVAGALLVGVGLYLGLIGVKESTQRDSQLRKTQTRWANLSVVLTSALLGAIPPLIFVAVAVVALLFGAVVIRFVVRLFRRPIREADEKAREEDEKARVQHMLSLYLNEGDTKLDTEPDGQGNVG